MIWMPFKSGNIAFTGTDGGIYAYISQGRVIYRSASSLTGARVKKDPAFEGFRKSCNRMKEASPIAAALYSQIPKEQKQFSLYRLLTGEALKMIKEGVDKAAITENLQRQYIDPLLQQEIKHQKSGETFCSRSSGRLFITDIAASGSITRLRNKRRLRQTAGIISSQSTHINIIPRRRAERPIEIHKRDARQSSTSHFVYLGRLEGYRGLRMWLIADPGDPRCPQHESK